MGLILDSSVIISAERGKFDMTGFLNKFSGMKPVVTAITASELLHGVERAQDDARRTRRSLHVEQLLSAITILPFDLAQARVHARIWADLERKGVIIGPHDLQIAAACIACEHDLATLNVKEFHRVPSLNLVDANMFLIS